MYYIFCHSKEPRNSSFFSKESKITFILDCNYSIVIAHWNVCANGFSGFVLTQRLREEWIHVNWGIDSRGISNVCTLDRQSSYVLLTCGKANWLVKGFSKLPCCLRQYLRWWRIRWWISNIIIFTSISFASTLNYCYLMINWTVMQFDHGSGRNEIFLIWFWSPHCPELGPSNACTASSLGQRKTLIHLIPFVDRDRLLPASNNSVDL